MSLLQNLWWTSTTSNEAARLKYGPRIITDVRSLHADDSVWPSDYKADGGIVLDGELAIS